jgi:DNA-binding CsgD family transcriptional regulator
MHVSRNTVKSHVVAIYRKLGVQSRSEAVTLSRRIGLLP